MASARAMLERRRASRVQIQIPVKVVSSETGVEPHGTPAEAVSVSRTGALLRLPFLPPLGSRIEVLHGLSNEVREFRVISVKDRNHRRARSSSASKFSIQPETSGESSSPTTIIPLDPLHRAWCYNPAKVS
jgi:hypothetical protein